jgi:chromosome partitioning protein
VNTEPSHPTPEVIAIVGQKDGVGKTTTAVNLALALAAAGRTVLLMDLDPNGNAGRSLVRGAHGGGGSERALLDTSFGRDMIAATEIPDLYLTPATPGLSDIENTLALMGDSRTRLYQALTTLAALPLRFDHVVIDCPPTLGLLTLNALTAAHRVLVPLTCDAVSLQTLPTLLTIIGRLRAGLSRPFYGVYLLISLYTGNTSSRSIIDSVRHDYGRMTLLTEIPEDGAVETAQTNERPLLVDTPSCPAAQSYLSLAAEWLTLAEPGDQPDGAWRFKARQERIAHHRAAMSRRIEAWLIDPSSLLYDEREAMHHQDTQVLEELFRVTQPIGRERLGGRGRIWLGAALSLALLIPLVLTARPWFADESRRFELGAWLIGTQHYWQAGSHLLARADADAYREIQLATRLLGDNRERIMDCGEQARARDAEVSCRIAVTPP